MRVRERDFVIPERGWANTKETPHQHPLKKSGAPHTISELLLAVMLADLNLEHRVITQERG